MSKAAAAPRALGRSLRALAALDPHLAQAIALVGPLPDRSQAPGFAALLKIQCEQQLSIASAAAIWRRVEAALAPVTPARFLAFDDVALRGLGFSRPKIVYGRILAQAVTDGSLDLDGLARLDDAAAMQTLTAIKGIGRWTAEVYLLFALGRTDIWPADDLALQAALHHLKALPARPNRQQMDSLAEAWRPHRGVAARVLWAYYRHIKWGGGQPPDRVIAMAGTDKSP